MPLYHVAIFAITCLVALTVLLSFYLVSQRQVGVLKPTEVFVMIDKRGEMAGISESSSEVHPPGANVLVNMAGLRKDDARPQYRHFDNPQQSSPASLDLRHAIPGADTSGVIGLSGSKRLSDPNEIPWQNRTVLESIRIKFYDDEAQNEKVHNPSVLPLPNDAGVCKASMKSCSSHGLIEQNTQQYLVVARSPQVGWDRGEFSHDLRRKGKTVLRSTLVSCVMEIRKEEVSVDEKDGSNHEGVDIQIKLIDVMRCVRDPPKELALALVPNAENFVRHRIKETPDAKYLFIGAEDPRLFWGQSCSIMLTYSSDAQMGFQKRRSIWVTDLYPVASTLLDVWPFQRADCKVEGASSCLTSQSIDVLNQRGNLRAVPKLFSLSSDPNATSPSKFYSTAPCIFQAELCGSQDIGTQRYDLGRTEKNWAPFHLFSSSDPDHHNVEIGWVTNSFPRYIRQPPVTDSSLSAGANTASSALVLESVDYEHALALVSQADDSESTDYTHDMTRQVFGLDGSRLARIVPLPRLLKISTNDCACLYYYFRNSAMQNNFHIHQATNILQLSLCSSNDPNCKTITPVNTVNIQVVHFITDKKNINKHNRIYEPVLLLWNITYPYDLISISNPFIYGQFIPTGDEITYTVSINFVPSRGSSLSSFSSFSSSTSSKRYYHRGFLDSELILSYGVADWHSRMSQVKIEQLLQDSVQHLCTSQAAMQQVRHQLMYHARHKTQSGFQLPLIRDIRSLHMIVKIDSKQPTKEINAEWVYLVDLRVGRYDRDPPKGNIRSDGWITDVDICSKFVETIYVNGQQLEPHNQPDRDPQLSWSSIPKDEWLSVYIEWKEQFDSRIKLFADARNGGGSLSAALSVVSVFSTPLDPSKIQELSARSHRHIDSNFQNFEQFIILPLQASQTVVPTIGVNHNDWMDSLLSLYSLSEGQGDSCQDLTGQQEQALNENGIWIPHYILDNTEFWSNK